MGDHRGASVLEVRGFTKKFGDFVAVDSLSLEVRRGDVYGFLGPNGSGKSTLLRMLMNLVKPTSGELELFGGASYPDDEVAIKQRVSYVPERSVGHDEMSAKSLGEFVSHWYPR